MIYKTFITLAIALIALFALGVALAGQKSTTITRAQALQAATTSCAGRFKCDPFDKLDEFEHYILTGEKSGT